MTEAPTIREAPPTKADPRYPKKDIELEPDPDKLCEHSFILTKSPTESEIIDCLKLADFRVIKYSLLQVLDGDASNPKDWKREQVESYWCLKHFDQEIRYKAPPTPLLTFRKINRPRQLKGD